METGKNIIKNKNELEFALFCIENVAKGLEIDGKSAYKLLTEKSDVLYSYIVPCYDVLHTQSKDYIVEDIIDLLHEKKGGNFLKLYHGYYIEITNPDILHSRSNLDFGKGFYTTPLLEQAKSRCKKFKVSFENAYVSVYNFNEKALSERKTKIFDEYNEDWLDFILNCRRGIDQTDHEIVEGGIANDKVFNTVELYFDGLIDKKEALKRLKYEKPNKQICFRNQEVIDKYLSYEGSYKL